MGFPPEIQPCLVCSMPDDRECNDPVCAITEHFILKGDLYCQICVEAKYETAFPGQQIGMYCKEHEKLHKSRMLGIRFI